MPILDKMRQSVDMDIMYRSPLDMDIMYRTPLDMDIMYRTPLEIAKDVHAKEQYWFPCEILYARINYIF